MNKWIPDRKVWAGGLSGLVAFFITQALGIDPETSTTIAGGLWAAVSYFLPQSARETVNKIDDTVRGLAVDEGSL